MARARREVWAARVERWLASGLGAREYAAQIGVNANTLAYWRWKLRDDSQAPDVPAFVEVTPASIEDGTQLLEVVVVGGRVVRVPPDFEPEVLRRLLDVLEGR